MFKMLTYQITSKFGQIDNFHPKPHSGVDFAAPAGTSAQSVTNGVVSKITTNDQWLGNSVRINGTDGKEWVYGHLSKINVSQGQSINSGDILGLTGGIPGTPGAGHSTGAHIHISTLVNGQIVDPTPVLTAVGQTDSTWIERLATSIVDKLLHVLSAPFRMMFDGIGNPLKDSLDPFFIILTIVLILLSMLGSRRAKKYTYWSISLYILTKLITASL